MTLLEEPIPATSTAAPPAPAPIPRRLEEPLQLVAGRARLLALLLGLFQLMALVLAAWLIIILILGGIREPALPLAFALAAAAWLTLLAGTVILFRPAFRRTDLSAAARMVDTALPDTDERISSALELTQEQDPRFRGSPELIAALVRQAEHHAEALDPNTVVSGRRVFHWFLGTVPLLLLWFILFIVMTPTLTLGIERLFQPWRAAAPVVTAILDVDPGNTTIAQGEELKIRVTVTPQNSLGNDPSRKVPGATISKRYSGGDTRDEVTTDMRPFDNRTFDDISTVEQSFSYRIQSMGASSPTYTVTVDPRPAVGNIQVDYTYPAYTGRQPHTETSKEGAVDALIGTKVRFTIDTTQPVKLARIVITDNAPDNGNLVLTPVDKTNTRFTTDFVVRKTTDYKIQLINGHDLESKDTRAHPITARIDAPPTVTITAPEGNLRIRPDDALQVRFTAADDLQLTKIEAVAQADDQPPIPFVLPALPQKAMTFTGTWSFSPRDVATPGHPLEKINRITYFLRATDNRDPEPQAGLSAKQTLEIDQKVAPLADRQDAQAARTLGEAVKQASSQLDDARQKLDALRQSAAGRPLTEAEKQQAGDARNKISSAAQTLQNAAEKTNTSTLAAAARRAREIADQPMKQADENTAAGQLAADQPDVRDKKFEAASQNIADAREKLDQLARDIDNKAKDQPLARELQRIAAEQKKLAEELALHPNDPTLLARQKQLQQELENVIRQHPELERPAVEAAKGDTQDVQKKLDDLAARQKQFNEQAKAQQDATIAQDKLNDLARRQEDLNKQIKDFSSQHADALRQADATHTPSASQLDSIPKDLRNRNLSGATQGQAATTNQLDQAAQQLENSQRREETGEGGIHNASDLQAQTTKLKQDIDEAERNHNPQIRPSDPSNQQASRLADAARHLAQQQALTNPSQRGAAKAAEEEADAAKREAAQGNAAAAQQHLSNAASQLGAGPGAGTAEQGKAAEEARRLAQEQRDIANQTSQTNQSLQTAENAKANSEQSAQEQQRLADKMEEAAKAARELQQKTQGGAPGLSQQAGQAAKSLQNAAQAQRAAAQATRNGNTSQSASQQAQAARALEDAQKSLQQDGQQSGQQSAQQNAQQESQNGNQRGGQQSGGQQSGQQSAQGGQGSGQQSGQQSAQGGQPGGQQGGQSGGQQGGQQNGQQSAQRSRYGSSGQPGSPGAGGQPGSASSGGSSGSPAAQAVQAARNAQSAAASGDPAAARKAADQLSEASQELFNGNSSANEATAGRPSPGNGNSSGRSAASDGRSRSPGGSPSATGGTGTQPPFDPNAPGGGGAGFATTPTQKPLAQMPKPVEEIGISPSDWAKLPPTAQQQLLNSAQQSGPPAYRDAIKNYYSRIAKLEQQPQGDTK